MIIQEVYKIYSKHYLVDTDTRSIRKNTIFFALKGANFNGNLFADEALKKGASFSIVDEKKYQTNKNIILVDDVLTCLQNLATYHRTVLNIPILSLTGSNGKTTTKELINVVLSKKFKTIATKGNLNNHIGVPLTLLSMDTSTEFGIVEMGANHLKEIEFLCNIAKPNFGYITNFGKAHIEGFGSIEGVIKGKSELLNYLRTNHGKVFVNPNDDLQIKQSEGIHTIPFEPSLENLNTAPLVSLSFKNLEIKSQLIGAYNFNNIAAAVSIGNYFEISIIDIKTAIENYTPTNNRSQIIQKENSKIILDAYNANPSSMEVALKSFGKLADTSKILVLGDMFELGEISAEEHQTIADLAETLNAKKVYLIGENFYKTSTKKALKYERFSDFINAINSKDFDNSTILIKGSRGMALEKLLSHL